MDSSQINLPALRDMLFTAAADAARVWCDDARFQDLLKSDGGFAVEMVRALANKAGDGDLGD